ncbi:MAG: hypothetical protein F6J86_14675 [Symploca sp. SIO1B1]|nr:hypothetical protein [Symploca sp. SIO1B1]
MEPDHQGEMPKTIIEQPVTPQDFHITPETQQQLVLGSIAIGTMACMCLLIREIRLLVQAANHDLNR